MTVSIKYRSPLIRLGKIFAFTAAILGMTALTLEFSPLASISTAAFSFLIIVLLSAFFGDLPVAIITSFAATLCFDYFYLPPTETFHISAFPDWISLAAFLLTSVIISRLTASASEYSKHACLIDKILAQLKEFGGWLLSIPSNRITLSMIAKEALRIFSLEYCSIHVYEEGQWQHFTGTAASEIYPEIEDQLKHLQDHPTDLMDRIDESMLGVKYILINKEVTPLAVLVVKSKTFPPDAMEAIAGMIGMKLRMVGEVTSQTHVIK